MGSFLLPAPPFMASARQRKSPSLRIFAISVLVLSGSGLAWQPQLATAQGQAVEVIPPGVWGPRQRPSPQAQAKAAALIDSISEPEIMLDLDPRRSKIIRTKWPVTRVSVTDPQILQVVQFSPTEFELIGGLTGQTSLTIWFGKAGNGGQLLRYLVRVAPNEAVEDRRKLEYRELEKKINALFPNSAVQLFPVADKLIVRGQARDSAEAAQILAMVRGQAPDQPGAGGFVSQGLAAEPFPGTAALPPAVVIDLLHVTGEMQVMLKVRMAELSRTALREMGSEFNIDAGDFTFDSLLSAALPVRAVLDGADVGFLLEALSTNSYGKILAEPNLVTLSGHTANFIAGGEFPVPTVVGVEGVSAVSTSFKGFGVQLEFTPTVLDKDRIRLHVAPSFSSRNEDNDVDGIPGLDTRAVTTTVDLREGQWLAIAGLLQEQQSGSKIRVPLLGDIPILDMLFSSKEVKREETELIILVSPELIHPLEAEEVPLILPGMEVTEPTDCDFYIKGNYEGRPDCHHRSTVWPVYQRRLYEARREAKRQAHYQESENYYFQGVHGFSR